MSISVKDLPQIIILYGPAGCGKGTQAGLLKEILKDYYHLDFGTELRKFVKENVDSEDENLKDKARKMKEQMDAGQPVDTPLLRFVVEDSIVKNVKAGKGMLVEGPGRKIEETEWLSNFFVSNGMTSAIFHLHIDLDVILDRLKTRWYLPSTSKPFISYQKAKAEAKDGEEPYQREDDVNVESVKQRYKLMYRDVFGEILKIYMIVSKTDILPINADQEVKKVHKDITDVLKGRYGYESAV
jgi:adenylate kinase family enzyme